MEASPHLLPNLMLLFLDSEVYLRHNLLGRPRSSLMWLTITAIISCVAAIATLFVSIFLYRVAKSTDTNTKLVWISVDILASVAREQALDSLCDYLVEAKDTFAIVGQAARLLDVNGDFQGKSRQWADLAEQLHTVAYRGREAVSWSLAKPVLEPVIMHTVDSVHQLTSALRAHPVDVVVASNLATEVRDQLDTAYNAIMPLLTHYLDERGALLDKLAGLG